jgi:hypothetical protein
LWSDLETLTLYGPLIDLYSMYTRLDNIH